MASIVPLPIHHPSAKTAIAVPVWANMIDLSEISNSFSSQYRWKEVFSPLCIKDGQASTAVNIPVDFDGIINLLYSYGQVVVRLANPDESWVAFKVIAFDPLSTKPLSSVLPSLNVDDLDLTLYKERDVHKTHAELCNMPLNELAKMLEKVSCLTYLF